MKMQYIKREIPEEFSDKGGAYVQLVNKSTVPLDRSIADAISGHYTAGQESLVKSNFLGLLKSMADGVQRDGNARQIEGLITVYPVFLGEIDLTRGFDPEKNGVKIIAHLLNELELDISDWTFEDVTPGRRSFSIDSVKAGETLGVVEIGKDVEVNGRPLPSTAAGEELRVEWAVPGTDKTGTVPAEMISSDISRVDIDKEAFAELASEEYDGLTLELTFRGNFAKAKKSAKLKYAEEPIATNTDGTVKAMSIADELSPEILNLDNPWTATFKGLADNAKWKYSGVKLELDGEELDGEGGCEGEIVTFQGLEGPASGSGDYDGTLTVSLEEKDSGTDTDMVVIPVHFHAEEH